jgi:hypothetical protein
VTTANDLDKKGFKVTILGEAETRGDLMVSGNGLKGNQFAESKLMNKLEDNSTLQKMIREAVNQAGKAEPAAGNAPIAIINGSKVGLAEQEFDVAYNAFLANKQTVQAGTVIGVMGDGRIVIKQFP